jgi:dipeptidyl aminopeptidase/acylaminoacyl peptidase
MTTCACARLVNQCSFGHGGPTGARTQWFDPLVPFLMGHGSAVFRPNPRGSTGYGVTFVAANTSDLGGGDCRDIMTGVDAMNGRSMPMSAIATR